MASSLSVLWNRAKPYVAVIFLQFGLAGMALIGKHALNQGLNHYTFVVYRHIIASALIAPFAIVLERKVRPKMTPRIFVKILLLALVEPVMDQNLYYIGMKYTSASFTCALTNVLPALTFIMAWIFKLEKVNIRSIHSLAKVAGTVVTVGGAMVMTLVRGPILPTPWINNAGNGGGHGHAAVSSTAENPIKGALMIGGACTCWASFVILQAVTVKNYPAELSLTALMCSLGSVLGLVLALIMEWGNWPIWSIHLDSKLLATVYSGIVCSGMGYYLQAVIMRTKGPVFVTAFSPLTMVLVAIFGSFFLSETLSLGRLVGALVIVTGLYLVIWGKSKDTQQTPVSLGSTAELMILPVDAPQSSTAKDNNKNSIDRSDHHLNVAIPTEKNEEVSVDSMDHSDVNITVTERSEEAAAKENSIDRPSDVRITVSEINTSSV